MPSVAVLQLPLGTRTEVKNNWVRKQVDKLEFPGSVGPRTKEEILEIVFYFQNESFGLMINTTVNLFKYR